MYKLCLNGKSSNPISERRYYLKYIFMESRARSKLACPEGSVYFFSYSLLPPAWSSQRDSFANK